MSDRVVGVAVLQRATKPYSTLWIMCETVAGPYMGKRKEWIPVRFDGVQDPAVWNATIRDNVIHVRPSVRVTTSVPDGNTMRPTEVFHNDGIWQVNFIECPDGCDADEMFEAANSPKPHHNE